MVAQARTSEPRRPRYVDDAGISRARGDFCCHSVDRLVFSHCSFGFRDVLGMTGRHALHTHSAARPVLPPDAGRAAVPTSAGVSNPPTAPTRPYRFGYRPAVVGSILHCVMPGRLVNFAGGHPISWAWCGAVAYLDNGPDDSWGRWPACAGCRPGYERHLILRLLAVAPPYGATARQLDDLLVEIEVDPKLTAMSHDGVVDREYGTDGVLLYRLSRVSATAVAYLEGQ